MAGWAQPSRPGAPLGRVERTYRDVRDFERSGLRSRESQVLVHKDHVSPEIPALGAKDIRWFGWNRQRRRKRVRKDVSMKAVVYHGPRDVRVSDVPDAEIERPTPVKKYNQRLRDVIAAGKSAASRRGVRT